MGTFSSRINDVLSARGWKGVDLVAASGLPQSTVQRYMSGYTAAIPSDKLVKIADALGVPTDYIMGNGPFAAWDDVLAHTETFIKEIARGQEDNMRCIWDIDAANPRTVKLLDLIAYIDFGIVSAKYENGEWKILKKVFSSDASAQGTPVTPNRQALYAKLDSMSEADIGRLLRLAEIVQGG